MNLVTKPEPVQKPLSGKEESQNYVKEGLAEKEITKIVVREVNKLVNGEGVISQKEVDTIFGIYLYKGKASVEFIVLNETTNLPIKGVKIEFTFSEDLQEANKITLTTDGGGKALLLSVKQGQWKAKILPGQDLLKDLKVSKGDLITDLLLEDLKKVTTTLSFVEKK